MPSRRLLTLVPYPPRLDGVHGGARVTAQKLVAQSERHELGILYLRGSDEAAVDPTLESAVEFAQAVRRRTLSDDPRVLWTERGRVGLQLRRYPAWVVSSSVARYGPALHDAVLRFRPAVVQAESIVMGQYARVVGRDGPRVVVVDLDSDPDAVASTWERYTRAISSTVDTFVALTEGDAALLRARTGRTPVVTVPLGFDLPALADPAGSEAEILFVGSFIHPPNVQAA